MSPQQDQRPDRLVTTDGTLPRLGRYWRALEAGWQATLIALGIVVVVSSGVLPW
jgi:hypothetical protein